MDLKTVLKQLVGQVLKNTVYPELKTLEDKIGSDAVRNLVESLTVAAEAEVDKYLAAL